MEEDEHMGGRRKWSPDKIYKMSRDYVNDREKRQFFETNSFATIGRYVETGTNLVEAASAAGLLWVWYYRVYVVSLAQGDAEGVRFAHLAACAQLVDSDFWYRHRVLTPAASRLPVVKIERCSYAFATFMTLGAMSEAEAVFRLELRCLRDGVFYKFEDYMYPRYLLEMFAAWKGERINLDGYGYVFGPMGAYGDLLAVWDTDDLSSLARAISAACDLHIARSRGGNLNQHFDFEPDWEWVFPVEIMCLLRLRELKRMPNPAVDHPLLAIPTARLCPIEDIPWNPLLLAGYTKACAELDERKGSVTSD
jgi:hypothetical protein